jgi:hypothetical protein
VEEACGLQKLCHQTDHKNCMGVAEVLVKKWDISLKGNEGLFKSFLKGVVIRKR